MIRLRPGRDHIGLIILLFVVAGGTLGFLALADAVVEGETEAFDRAIILFFRRDGTLDPAGPVWLQEMMRDLSGLGSFGVLSLVVLFAVAFLAMSGKRGAAVLVLASVLGGQALSSLLKAGFDRARPDLVPHVTREFTASFPSGHAMLSAVTYLTIGALLTRTTPRGRLRTVFVAAALTLTLLVGVSRVYLGVHWPTDVLAGWCVGAAWAMACWVVAQWLQGRGQVEQPAEGTGAGDDR